MLSALIPSAHSYPALLRAEQPADQRCVLFGPLVLEKTPFKNLRLQEIGDRPGSRRSEPSSRAFLIGEQPNPWELLHPQDKTSRHRGAEPSRRYGRLGRTSLFNAYALDYIFFLSPVLGFTKP